MPMDFGMNKKEYHAVGQGEKNKNLRGLFLSNASVLQLNITFFRKM